MISFVRGDTFIARIVHTPVAGSLPTMQNLTITSQVQTSDGKRYDGVINMNPDFMSFTVKIEPTNHWSVGTSEWDLKVIYQGKIIHTKKLQIEVTKQITL